MQFSPLFPEFSASTAWIIAGPCSAETREQTLSTAQQLSDIGIKFFRAGLWKPRTRPGGFEGVGAVGLDWLKEVKTQTGMHPITEVATAEHVALALEAGINTLWVGARTATNPFAVQQIADALQGNKEVAVLIKNPMIPDLDLWVGAIERFYKAGVSRLGAIHRGFGSNQRYRNAPQWHVPMELRRLLPTLPILCDPSHIAGRRDLVCNVAQQAIDMHFQGLFIEAHCTPSEAWSDAQQQITPQVLKQFLEQLVIRDNSSITEELNTLRKLIDDCDSDLIHALSKRMQIVKNIGLYKSDKKIPIVQTDRYNRLIENRLSEAQELGLHPDFVQNVLEIIHEESVRLQLETGTAQEERDDIKHK